MIWLMSGGCASLDRYSADAAEAVWLDLACQWSGQSVHWVDLVTVTILRTGEQHVLRYDTELFPGGLVMLAQTPLGAPLYELRVINGRAATASYIEGPADLPMAVLADFVFAHWPLEQVRTAARSIGYTVATQDEGRQLLDRRGLQLIAVASRTGAGGEVIEIVHADAPLRVSIQRVSSQPLDA